jgi:prophage antirepressor-like protein
MNASTSTVPFNYNGIPLAAIEHEEDLWLTGSDIGNALEYKDPSDAIKKLYKRNQAELDQHSIVLKLPIESMAAGTLEGSADTETDTWGDSLSPQVGVEGSETPPAGTGITQLRPVRVFNEEGVMILTMLSSQPKAALFRAWAVGVLKAFRHGNLTISSPANRQRLLETCIKESRWGNPVAVHTLIQHFGYPETIRREIKSSLLKRAQRHSAQTPELVDWFLDTFLPRLRDEIEGEPGVYLAALRSRPPYFTSWREIKVEGARWCLQFRRSDMYSYIAPLAEQEGVDAEITSHLFNKWIIHVGSAVYAVPPGVADGGYWGQQLLEG